MSIRSLLEVRSRKSSDHRDRKRDHAHRRNRLLRHEALEDRRLLATTAGWMFSIGGSDTAWEESDSIAVGAAGDVYVSGQFYGTADFDPSSGGVCEMTALGSPDSDRFIAKYSAAGEFRWAHHLGGYGYEGPGRIALDEDDSVYFVASYSDSQAHLDGNPMYDQSGELVETELQESTFFAKFDKDGNDLWVEQLHGNPATDYAVRGNNIVVHEGGTTENPSPSIYIVGAFSGTVDFDPSSSTNDLTYVGDASDRDIFVAKYDTEGSHLWAQRAGGDGLGSTVERDAAVGVAVDTAGNAYVVGYFHGSADFGDTILTSKGRVWDSFVTKLAAGTGEFQWAKRMGGDSQETDQDRANAVVVSASGEVYVGGKFYGTGDFGETTLVSQGSSDAFLSKLDSGGNFLWTTQFGAGGEDSVGAVALDGNDDVYTAGHFADSVDFDPGDGNAVLTANEDSQNTFVVKLDSAGAFLSARRMGGQGATEYPRGIQVFDDDIYTTGTFRGVGDFDTGTETAIQTSSGTDVFVVKTTQDRGAILGRVFVDSNENNVFDSGELPLAGRTVYLDQNQNGMLDAGEATATTGPAGDYVFQHLLADTPYYLAQQLPPGWEETAAPEAVTLTAGEFRTDQDFGTFAAADVSIYTQSTPKNLRDNGTVTSALNVTDTYSILDLNVKIDITHTNVEDLSATLINPAGTRVPLFYRVGGTGDNFTATVFDDQATTPISAGTAPFTGSFVPDSPLGTLANESVNGTWVLEVRDHTKGVRGTLNYWSLEVTHLASGPVNTPPTAVNDSDTMSEDTSVTIDVLANDSDPDTGDAIQVSGITQGVNGSVVNNGGLLVTYTPTPDFNGVDTFTYTISDGNGGFDTATVTVTVNPVNDPPVAHDQSPATDEDRSLPITLTGSDVDGDSLTFTVVSEPSNGFLSGTAPDLRYMPAADFNGADSFTFSVNDGTVDSDPATVSITVNPINDAPIISDIADQTIDEDTETGALALTIGDVDTLLDSLTVSGESSNTTLVPPSNIVLAGSGANRTVTVTPAPDQYGTATISVTVDDGSETATDTFVVTVTTVNDAPVADDQNVAAKEDTDKAITLTASDVEDDELTYTVLNGPANGSLTGTGAIRTYIPNDNFNGLDSFTFQAYDGSAYSNVATVSITVAKNNVPVADSQSVSVDEDNSIAITLTGLDPDGDPITFAVTSQPLYGTLSGTGVSHTYTPDSNFNGSDSFTFKVNDGTDDSTVATVWITVDPVNDQPTADDQSENTSEDIPLFVTLTGDDIDGDALTFEVVSGPGNGTLTGTAPNLTYTSDGDFNGTDSFTFKVNDGTVDSAEATVSITIDPVNDAPVAVNDSANTDQDTAVTVDVLANDTDVDNDPLTITITSDTNGTALINNQGTPGDPTDDVVDFTPTEDFSGQASFTYTVNDGELTSNAATVTIDVTPVSPGPILDKGQVVARSDQWTTVTLDNSYTSMVVVLTPNYDRTQVPMVARMREVSDNTIAVKLDRTDGQTGAITDIPVHYMVVEEGVYSLADDGLKMEAVKFTSTRTDENNSWVGETRSYLQSYSQPVVVGQVMSYNDSDWSVFWARGSSRTAAPNGSLYVGKHVGEDPDNIRADETIGYIVIEGGAGSIGDIGYVAGLGTDTIRGVTDGNGFTYNIEHLDNADFAVASAAGMDGGNGGWPVLYGGTPVTDDSLVLGFDEDQMKDSERAHTTEQVAYIVLDPPAESFVATDTNQDGHVTPLDALLVINWLNASGSSHTNADTQPLDVNHDGTLTPADALWVINDLNRGASGEGEAVLRDTHAAERQMATARALDRIFNDLGDEADAWSLSDDLLDDIA